MKVVLGRVLKNIFITLCGLLLLAYLLIWALSPWIIKSQAKPILKEFSYQLEESSHLRFNPFTFTLSFDSLALTDLANENTHASIKQGHINLDSFGLLRNAIVFESVSFDNAELEVSHASDTLTVAGFAIELYEQAHSEEPAPETEDGPPSEWRVEILNFSITNFLTRLDHQEKHHALNLNQLSLDNVALSLSDQRGALSLNAQMNDAILAGQVKFGLQNEVGQANISLSLENFNPQPLIYLGGEIIENASANISAKIEQTITLSPDTIALDIQNLSLKIEQLAATTAGVEASNSVIELSAKDAELAIEKNTLSSLDGTLNIDLQGLAVSPAAESSSENKNTDTPEKSSDAKAPRIFTLSSLSLNEITLSLDEQKQVQLIVPQIVLKDILASDIGSESPADQPLFKTDSFELNNIAFNPNQLTIESAVLASFIAALHIDSEKNIANLVMPTKPKSDTNSAPSESAQTLKSEANGTTDVPPEPQDNSQQADASNQTEEGFRFSLGQFIIDGDSTFAINDESVNPAFSEDFTLSNISLGAFDSADRQSKSPYSLSFKAGQYANGSLKGSAAVFSEKLNLDLEAAVKEFSLPRISPYVRGQTGMDMLSGQLDNALSLTIVEDELDGISTLMLRGLEVETASDVKTGDIGEHAFIPLGLALGALKDSDGNIEMDIPLSGNVNDPDVGLNGFIYLVSQKAALAAAESYAINTFVPYANIVSLTKMAGEYALKVRIEDLIYEPAQVELSSEQSEFINGFVALLNQKPDLQVKACPFASAADLESGDIDLKDKDTVSQLKKIAKARGDHFKDAMIKQYGIASARLLICQATIDGSEEAQPRIEFNI